MQPFIQIKIVLARKLVCFPLQNVEKNHIFKYLLIFLENQLNVSLIHCPLHWMDHIPSNIVITFDPN